MPENINHSVNVLSVFDFDGTLTYHDSFIPFLKFAFGKYHFSRKIIRLVLPTLKCARRKLTRDELKEVLIKTFLTGIDEKWLIEKAEQFCQIYWPKLMRPSGLRGVTAEIESGAEVTICSASPSLVLKPFAQRLGIKLISTELEIVDGKLTGNLVGKNCRREEKIKRLEHVYGDLSQYHLRAWGDSRGDFELLQAAQDAHWRHFHKKHYRYKYKQVVARDD
ncbi:HAD family hydrolase [Providencia sneebia]|uniref:Phosphotransferase/phosphoserine phosphatase n=1 Tax=Providencia sneebia DSM 19967 TaxID=1141660 RepID=K8VZ78_9GAMM|nr:HAD family hydrolase [Providencia sneebia]EKT53588.1 phosphotransferase/phosphoserine phosphatase [Providencia sneebia DSM 19967]